MEKRNNILKVLATSTLVAGIGFTTMASSVSAQEVTVNKGDTLWNISKENNVSVNHIKEVNSLKGDIILAGQKLELGQKTNNVKQDKTYKVKEGDTLWGISEKNGTSVGNLQKLNNLTGDVIHVGDVLKVGGTVQKTTATKQTPVAPKQSTKQQVTQTQQTKQATQTSKPVQSETKQQAPQGKTLTVQATAYTADCAGCSGVTSTGIDLNKNRNAKVIAVDPSVIPLGSKVHVEGYGTAIAGDTGGAIKGNRIDLHVPTKDQAYSFGNKSVKVTILN